MATLITLWNVLLYLYKSQIACPNQDRLFFQSTIFNFPDGVNNAGKIDPLTSAKAAKALGIKIYTIGAGKPGGAMYPVEDAIFGKRYVHMNTEIDEELLKKIADETGGLYFRAKDKEGLMEIYKTIGQLEKTKIETKEYANYTELAGFFMLPGFILILLEILLANTLFSKIP